MSNLFTEHPSEQQSPQTYWEHGLFAIKYSTKGLIAGLSGYVHAVFPFLLPDTAANTFIEVYIAIEESGRHDKEIREIRDKKSDYYLVKKSKKTGQYLKELAV